MIEESMLEVRLSSTLVPEIVRTYSGRGVVLEQGFHLDPDPNGNAIIYPYTLHVLPKPQAHPRASPEWAARPAQTSCKRKIGWWTLIGTEDPFPGLKGGPCSSHGAQVAQEGDGVESPSRNSKHLA